MEIVNRLKAQNALAATTKEYSTKLKRITEVRKSGKELKVLITRFFLT